MQMHALYECNNSGEFAIMAAVNATVFQDEVGEREPLAHIQLE